MANDERKRALEAAQILKSSVFQDATDGIIARSVEAWRNAKTAQEREEAWHLQRAVAILQREIFNVLQCAAVNASGKDEVLNEAISDVKEKVNGRRNGRKRG